jgi:hypothetical protein
MYILKFIIFVSPPKEAVKRQIFWRMEETARGPSQGKPVSNPEFRLG